MDSKYSGFAPSHPVAGTLVRMQLPLLGPQISLLPLMKPIGILDPGVLIDARSLLILATVLICFLTLQAPL